MESQDLQAKLQQVQVEQRTEEAKQQPAKKGLTWLDKVLEMQFYKDRVRNICILAHVDHGKTTLSDSLISSNQIINHKMAGQLRYLDSREDEQQRMITMKASSISLLYSYKKRHRQGEEVTIENLQYLVNLMDSPGHVDFSNEVSSALRMSDGGLVIVDVNEGVSPQTHTVIKQAWAEKVKICLVLNKIDRLIIDREMDGSAIYQTLVQVVEQVNGIVSELIKADLLETQTGRTAEEFDALLQEEEEKQLFRPETGNVAFSSGYDCWSFTLPGFIPNVAKKVGMNPRALLRFMWDQYYFDPSTKKVSKTAPSHDSKEMFVQFVMQPLVDRYNKFFNEEVVQSTSAIKEAHGKIKEKLGKLMPMEDGVLKMVCDHLPSPDQAQKLRYRQFCPFLANPALPPTYHPIRNAIENCKSGEDIPTSVYVTKMQPFSARLYDITTRAQEKSKEKQRLIAISRVFSGTLKVGQKVYVMGPRHQINGQKDVKEATIEHLFLLMGSSIKLVNQVPAGSIVGIGGLDDVLIKTGTISTDVNCPNFTKSGTISMGLVKVAIETLSIAEMPQLKQGLIKLNKSDPSVQFFINNRGEYILSTCGEIHLERCLKDLKDDFCPGLELNVSDPIIPFRETILNKKLSNRVAKNKQEDFEEINSSDEEEEKEIAREEMTVAELLAYEEKLEKYNEQLAIEKELLKKEQSLDPYLEKLLEIKLQQGDEKLMGKLGEQKGWAKDFTANKQCRIKVRAVSLDFQVCKWIEKNLRGLRDCFELSQAQSLASVHKQKQASARNFITNFFKTLEEHKVNQKLVRYIRDSTSCFGPRRLGSNMLINKFQENQKSFFRGIESLLGGDILPPLDITAEKQAKLEKEAVANQQRINEVLQHNQVTSKELNSAMISGFDLATFNGPLMDEPMQGAVFIIEDIELTVDANEATDNQNYGPFGGQVMGTLKNLCKKAFLNSDPRIVEGMYKCSMQASPETYGVVYNVIHRFRGRVIQEEIQNGTNFFLIDALIPLVEGFEFNDYIRKQSSGIAQPQLVFYGYEVNASNDPLFIPKTMEELEDHGTGDILVDNIAKKIIERVRKQKGLIITKKILLDGEKQRTLTKNK